MRLKSSTFLIRPSVRSATSDGPVDEVAAGDLDVLTRDGGPHLIDGQAVGVEPVGVQQQLDLAPAIALQLDRPDVLQRLEHLLDLLVRDLGDLLLRSRPVDVELQNRRRVGILFLDLRRPGVARKLADDGRDLVADVLRGRLDVALEREGDVHRAPGPDWSWPAARRCR